MKTLTFTHDYDDPGDQPGNFTLYRAGRTYERVRDEVADAAVKAGAAKPAPEPKADAGR